MRKILEAIWRKTQMFPDDKKTTKLKFLKNLREGSQKRLSQEFRRTENRIRGALARLDDYLMNPLIQRRRHGTH